MGSGGSFLGVNLPGREADHSPPSSADVKNVGAILHPPLRLYNIVLIYILIFLFLYKVIKNQPTDQEYIRRDVRQMYAHTVWLQTHLSYDDCYISVGGGEGGFLTQ
jgi:hypothetical protein